MFRIHTFEMQKIIDSNVERGSVLKSLRGIQFEITLKESYTRFRYYGLAGKGVVIIVFLHKYIGRHKVCLQINPCMVLGVQEKEVLFDVREGEFQKCLQRVDRILSKYHLDLCDYRITRVDFTQDIRFEQSEIIDVVIKLLKRTGAPRSYHDKSYGDKAYKDSYNIEDCEKSEIVVYNKEKQYADRDRKQRERMKGVMRVEVRIKISDRMGDMLYFPNLLNVHEYAEIKIKSVFVEGFYLKVQKTKNILNKEYGRSVGKKRQRNKLSKMIEFAEKVAVHQSLRKCIGGGNALFCYDTTKDIMKQLGERRINLVSISAKEQVTVIPDMLYMLEMKSDAEMCRDNQFLMENNLWDKMPVYELV